MFAGAEAYDAPPPATPADAQYGDGTTGRRCDVFHAIGQWFKRRASDLRGADCPCDFCRAMRTLEGLPRQRQHEAVLILAQWDLDRQGGTLGFAAATADTGERVAVLYGSGDNARRLETSAAAIKGAMVTGSTN